MEGEPSGTCDNPLISACGFTGDCRAAALVSREGPIDWYCPVRQRIREAAETARTAHGHRAERVGR